MSKRTHEAEQTTDSEAQMLDADTGLPPSTDVSLPVLELCLDRVDARKLREILGAVVDELDRGLHELVCPDDEAPQPPA